VRYRVEEPVELGRPRASVGFAEHVLEVLERLLKKRGRCYDFF
jgi:hypothetical protein